MMGKGHRRSSVHWSPPCNPSQATSPHQTTSTLICSKTNSRSMPLLTELSTLMFSSATKFIGVPPKQAHKATPPMRQPKNLEEIPAPYQTIITILEFRTYTGRIWRLRQLVRDRRRRRAWMQVFLFRIWSNNKWKLKTKKAVSNWLPSTFYSTLYERTTPSKTGRQKKYQGFKPVFLSTGKTSGNLVCTYRAKPTARYRNSIGHGNTHLFIRSGKSNISNKSPNATRRQ